MSLRPNLVVRVACSAARRSTPRSNRTYASYPFTKDSADTAAPNPRKTAKNPYPFEKPSQPEQTTAPTKPLDRSGPTTDEGQQTALEYRETSPLPHQPDYNAAADYRQSAFSPIPMRVMDGSEDTDVTAAAVLSGAPIGLQARTLRIYKPVKTATQSGDWHGHQWRMDWDILQKGHRWENPLMGWQSSADFMQGTKVTFKSKEDAIRFAEKQGYEYFVQEPNERRILPKAYATQFVHVPGKLKTVRTK